MKVFLTGATGAVGSAVAARLHERDHEIVALVRSSASETHVRSLGYSAVRGDMTQPEPWLADAARADAIVHAAWVRPGQRMDRSWLANAMAADSLATAGLVRAATMSTACRALVLTSGHSVYGSHGDAWIDENTTPVPKADTMGQKQLACERVAMTAFDGGLPACVLRPCTVYGSGGPAMDYFFGSASQHRMEFPGDGENFFPFVHESDLADGYVRALEHLPAGEIISLGDDEPMRLREVCALMLDHFGGGEQVSLPKRAVADQAGGPFADIMTASCRVRNDKAKTLLDWSPRFTSLRSGLPTAVAAWKRSHQSK